MKICQRHFGNLYSMVKRKRMGKLVSASDVDAAVFAQKWLRGDPIEMAKFDALAICTIEIYGKAKEVLGNAVVNGSCPLCAAAHFLGPKVDESWIDNCTDAVYKTALENALV